MFIHLADISIAIKRAQNPHYVGNDECPQCYKWSHKDNFTGGYIYKMISIITGDSYYVESCHLCEACIFYKYYIRPGYCAMLAQYMTIVY